MRICLFTDTYFPQTCKRSAYIKTLYDSLVSRGHRVLIVIPDFETRQLFVEDDVMHCPARKRPQWNPRNCRLMEGAERFRRMKEFNPDVLHAHDCSALGSFAMKFSRRFDLPLLFTFHDPAETRPDDAQPATRDKNLVSVYKRLAARTAGRLRQRDMRAMFSLADLVTSPSGRAQSSLFDMQIERRVEYIPNSVNSEMFDPRRITEDEKWSLRNRLGLSGEQKLVLFAGVLSPDKNLNAILSAWAKRLRDEDHLRLVIAGSGSEQEMLEAAASRLGLSDQVVFTGSLSHDEMAVLYSISMVYLSALVSHTIPLSTLEAMAAGLPVILRYDRENLGHISERRNGFFFKSGKEMCALIKQFAALEPEEMGRVKQAVMKSVAKSGAEEKADTMIDAYARTVSRHYNGHE